MFISGLIPSPPDERDYTLETVVSYKSFPVKDITVPYVPEPFDQGNVGVCAAVTLAGILEAIEHEQRGVRVPLSIKYLYGNRGARDHQGEGMMPRQLLQMATRFGTPRRELLPGVANYPASREAITPSLDGEGLPNRPKGYVRLRGLQDIYDYMTRFGFPVFFGMQVTESFMKTGADGMIPAPEGRLLGGHAMRCIGIRLLNGVHRLVLQNSWGASWGDNWLGYLSLDDGHRMVEAWGLLPEQSDTLIQKPQTIMLRIGSNTVHIDSVAHKMDVAPFILNQRTWVPLRFIAEYLGMKVEWYPTLGTGTVVLRDGGEFEKLEE